MPSESRFDLAGKHALVTGGARGIGLAIATMLAEHGARVSVVSRSAEAKPVTLPLAGGGAQEAFRAQADITDEAQVVRSFAQAREANGPIDVLVNNSGIAESAPLLRTSLAMFERIIATNLTGTFLCTREAFDDMLRAKWGRIVNVASIAGVGGAAYISAYCASKHGVVGFTRAIAAEIAGTGITCNALCPGYTDTDMMRQAMANISKFTGATEEAARQQLAQSNPGGRIASVEEVADSALELITGTRNGAAMIVPGGIAM